MRAAVPDAVRHASSQDGGSKEKERRAEAEEAEQPVHHGSSQNGGSKEKETREEAGEAEQHLSAEKPPRAPKQPAEVELQQDWQDVGDRLTIQVRHAVRQMQLLFVNYWFPLGWNWRSFREGSEDAVKIVFELLAQGALEDLEGLVEEALLQELQEAQPATAEQRWAAAPELVDLQIWGIFTAEAEGTEDSIVLRVTPLLLTTERYTYEADLDSENTSRLVRRWQRWTFQQRYSPERGAEGVEEEGWKVAHIGEPWYWKRP